MPISTNKAIETTFENRLVYDETTDVQESQALPPDRAWLACFADVFVMLCDWRGRFTWTSGGDLQVKVGEYIWEHLAPESMQQAKFALGQVIAIRESRQLEVVFRNGEHFRGWMRPLESPDVAVCILGSRIPGNLGTLSQRERDCLEWLAQGIEPRVIAEKLDVSLSTIHTHLKHAREKQGLSSIDALISFAARYCYPVSGTSNTQE